MNSLVEPITIKRSINCVEAPVSNDVSRACTNANGHRITFAEIAKEFLKTTSLMQFGLLIDKAEAYTVTRDSLINKYSSEIAPILQLFKYNVETYLGLLPGDVLQMLSRFLCNFAIPTNGCGYIPRARILPEVTLYGRSAREQACVTLEHTLEFINDLELYCCRRVSAVRCLLNGEVHFVEDEYELLQMVSLYNGRFSSLFEGCMTHRERVQVLTEHNNFNTYRNGMTYALIPALKCIECVNTVTRKKASYTLPNTRLEDVRLDGDFYGKFFLLTYVCRFDPPLPPWSQRKEGVLLNAMLKPLSPVFQLPHMSRTCVDTNGVIVVLFVDGTKLPTSRTYKCRLVVLDRFHPHNSCAKRLDLTAYPRGIAVTVKGEIAMTTYE